MKSKPIILCSNQRSGTGALGSALESQNRVKSFFEIFLTQSYHVEYVPSNYFYWLSNIKKSNIVFYGRGEVEKYVSEYFDYLSSLCDKEYFLVDIKYNQWSHIVGESNNVFYPPVLMGYFMRMGYPIIHLVRDNCFDQYVSTRYAEEIGYYHYRKDTDTSDPEPIKLTINIPDCEIFIETLRQNMNLFKQYMKCYDRSIELHYNYCFHDNCVTSHLKDRLHKLLRCEDWVFNIETPLRKTPVDILRCITNPGEVVSHFVESEYSWMFEGLTS